MTEQKTARIALNKALMTISLTTLAAIGSAAGVPWVAGVTALPAAIAASETLHTFLKREKEASLELLAPPIGHAMPKHGKRCVPASNSSCP